VIYIINRRWVIVIINGPCIIIEKKLKMVELVVVVNPLKVVFLSSRFNKLCFIIIKWKKMYNKSTS
jgi:hypothetical protein